MVEFNRNGMGTGDPGWPRRRRPRGVRRLPAAQTVEQVERTLGMSLARLRGCRSMLERRRIAAKAATALARFAAIEQRALLLWRAAVAGLSSEDPEAAFRVITACSAAQQTVLEIIAPLTTSN